MDQDLEPPARDSNDRNALVVICKVCQSSKILQNGISTYVNMEYSLPPMKTKKDTTSEENKEMFQDWWVVDEITSFENIAVSYKVEDIKYLACADCENGPVGYHDLKTGKSYIAHARVMYKPPPNKSPNK